MDPNPNLELVANRNSLDGNGYGAPPAKAMVTVGREFGDGSYGHWISLPRGETSPTRSSSSSLASSSPGITSTVPIYDASGGRNVRDVLRRLRTSPSLVDSVWKAPVGKSDLDQGPPSHSKYEWSPSKRGSLMASSSAFPPTQEDEWQKFRRMPHDLPPQGLGKPPGGAEHFSWATSARSMTNSSLYDPNHDLNLGGHRGFQIPTPKPWLNVFPEQIVNFAGRHIRFAVHVNDLPLDVPLNACTVEGVATTPRGIPIPCNMRKLTKINIFQKDIVQGIFPAPGEAGLYNLRVKLTIPLSHSQLATEDQVVIEEEVEILVSRNYFRASTQQFTQSFLVNFVPNWRYPEMGHNGHAGVSDPRSLSKAWGLTCDKFTDRFYHTDRSNHSLTCLDAEGRIIFTIPLLGSRPLFNRPTGICFDEVHRRLIVADKDSHAISFLSMDGEFISAFGGRGHLPGQFNFPWDVAVSPTGGQIAVTDSRNKRVQLFDRNGNFLNKFSVFEHNPYEYKKSFEYPRGVTFSKDGTAIFVTDFNVNNILQIPTCMTTLSKVLPDRKLDRPQGIVVDALGNLLVCDSRNGCVRHVHPESGQVLTSIHSVGPEKLHFPVNLTLMGDGRVAVLDSQGKIRIF